LLLGLAASIGVCAANRDGDWPMPARDLANTRYAPLADINTANVGTLRLAFTFSTGVSRGHEAAPIVVGDTMYIVTPYPNIVYALELSRSGMRVRWKFEPKPEPFAQGVACCDVVNLGLAVADGRVIVNTLDNQTIALNASDGKERWRFRSADPRSGETRTMAPLVVKGRVLIGNDGSAFGVRGWLIALDQTTGKELWRAYSTGPDREVLIGSDYKPFYAKDRGIDLGGSHGTHRTRRCTGARWLDSPLQRFTRRDSSRRGLSSSRCAVLCLLRLRHGALFREPRSRQRPLAVHCRLRASCRGDHRRLVLDHRVARLARRLVLDHRRQLGCVRRCQCGGFCNRLIMEKAAFARVSQGTSVTISCGRRPGSRENRVKHIAAADGMMARVTRRHCCVEKLCVRIA